MALLRPWKNVDRAYTLTIETLPESDEMEKAFNRSFQNAVPVNRMIYRMSLTDESQIPLTKLGAQTMTVYLPVPDALSGQRLRLLVLDRNGQVEDVPLERVSADGRQMFQFQMNYVSQFVLYGTGDIGSEMPVEVMDVTINSLSAAPGAVPSVQIQEGDDIIPLWRRLEFWVGGALLLTGVILLTAGYKNRR